MSLGEEKREQSGLEEKKEKSIRLLILLQKVMLIEVLQDQNHLFEQMFLELLIYLKFVENLI